MTLCLTPQEFKILSTFKEYAYMLEDAKLIDWFYKVQPYPMLDRVLMRSRLSNYIKKQFDDLCKEVH